MSRLSYDTFIARMRLHNRRRYLISTWECASCLSPPTLISACITYTLVNYNIHKVASINFFCIGSNHIIRTKILVDKKDRCRIGSIVKLGIFLLLPGGQSSGLKSRLRISLCLTPVARSWFLSFIFSYASKASKSQAFPYKLRSNKLAYISDLQHRVILMLFQLLSITIACLLLWPAQLSSYSFNA